MSTDQSPILSIAIPTWNRATYLAETLKQLTSELRSVNQPTVEILVSDNGSTDKTSEVIDRCHHEGLKLTSIRNSENIGSDANIAQCFNLAKGKYVLILGDDDVFVDGGLKALLDLLEKNDYGVVCMRSYSFDSDFSKEHPGGEGAPQFFENVDNFFKKLGPLITLISVCVINKELLPDVDASVFCGSNLVQVHLVARAAIAAKRNVFFNRYLIACKRNNSGGYSFSKIFVANFFGIMETYIGSRFTEKGLKNLESRMMLGFYPFYLYKMRVYGDNELTKRDRLIYEKRFKGRWQYEMVLAPILSWPRPFAVFWGALSTLLGRIAQGDFRRGCAFAINKMRQALGAGSEV
ncbi:hypothetical protein PHIN8_03330 [Polynucleobacter sp. HIN8]|uniref:glycosyltransferase family 2 protein n=1 Tax=Polynucleobacter sp. HIN8 TaxID=3047867 RepID=UPI002574789A|nr:glycosyltransferase family 2 protein [Polynucleobacter sp. HIN8]BEI38389.1 hypothetical protein PHIN8_03330 [Polynucleobacter sp. HIN8]